MLRSAVYGSFAMLAGMQLDLFTPLKDGPMSAGQLALALGVDRGKLGPLLYALVVAGLLTVEEDRFYNTEETAHFLVRGIPSYVGSKHQATFETWSAVLKTAESVRTGSAQAKIDFSALSPEEVKSKRGGRHIETMAAGRELVARYDFSSYRTLVDVGGGSGGVAIAVTEACPHIQATVADLPNVIPATRSFLEEAGATERVQAVAADAVEGSLTGSFDVAVLRNFIQVLSPGQARLALRNVSQAIKPGGAIYVLGHIIDDSRISPRETVAFNLYFLNIYDGGQAYTEQEYRGWLAEAGFESIERDTLPHGTSIILARKPV
jgi:ubiquinone/menaquinone biosynthesis C-methylase UbiE